MKKISAGEKFQNYHGDSMRKFMKELLDRDRLLDDVYHYTDSFEKLTGILERRQLIMRMHTRCPIDINEIAEDDEEISHSLSILRKSSIWNMEFKIPSQKLPELKIFGDLFNYWIDDLRFFTASFSCSRDAIELWRMPHLRGIKKFSIKISKEHFNSAFEKSRQDVWDRNKPFNGIMRVDYDEKILGQFIGFVRRELLRLEKNKFSKKYWNGILNIFSKITPLLPKFLNEYNYNENEYRIYTQDIGFSEKEKISNEIIKKDNDGYSYLYSETIEPHHIKEILVWDSKDNFLKTKDKIKEILGENLPEKDAKNIEINRSDSV